MGIEGLMNLLKNFLFWLKLFSKIDFYCGIFLFLRLGFWMPNSFNLGKNNS